MACTAIYSDGTEGITVYAQERIDGLMDLIQTKATASYEVPVLDANNYFLKDINKQILSIAKIKRDVDTVDLYPLYSVLVSIAWNKNDDIFTPEPVWAARNSPEDKPFNLMHNQADVIGHITDCFPVDADFSRIEDSIANDKVPGKFHIITAAVIYKFWEDPKRQAQMDKIIAEIVEGKWYVSMECLFRGFDYGVLRPDGDSKIIARTAETAGLTKYLRAYGGPGIYNGYKLGRVLKEITFSGKGLVNNPANPESTILNNFDSTQTSLGYINTVDNISLKGTDMANDVVDLLKAEIAELKTQLEAQKSDANIHRIHVLENQIDALKKGKDEHELEMKKHMAEKDALSSTHKDEISSMSAQLKALAAEKEEKEKMMKDKEDCAAKEIERLKAENEFQKKALDEYKKASKKKERETAIEKTGIGSKFVEGFVNTSAEMTDEQFTRFITTIAELAEAVKVNEHKPAGMEEPSNLSSEKPSGLSDPDTNPGNKKAGPGKQNYTGAGDGAAEEEEKKAKDKVNGTVTVNPNDIISTGKAGIQQNLGVSVTSDNDSLAKAVLAYLKASKGEK